MPVALVKNSVCRSPTWVTFQGDASAKERFVALVCRELRGIAHRQLRLERPGHTLGTTGLVHETYVRLIDQTRVEWRDRGQFFGAAAGIMRRVLVDYARPNRAARRGGGSVRVTLNDDVPAAERSERLLVFDEALERLAPSNLGWVRWWSAGTSADSPRTRPRRPWA